MTAVSPTFPSWLGVPPQYRCRGQRTCAQKEWWEGRGEDGCTLLIKLLAVQDRCWSTTDHNEENYAGFPLILGSPKLPEVQLQLSFVLIAMLKRSQPSFADLNFPGIIE